MCQRVLISKSIYSISTRSFERNLEIASGKAVTALKLARLNTSLDSLYELIYSQFNDIDTEDYKILGPQLALLLQTVKNLYLSYKSVNRAPNSNKEIEGLWNNYSALYELKEDIEKYRLNRVPAKHLRSALAAASSYIDKI